MLPTNWKHWLVVAAIVFVALRYKDRIVQTLPRSVGKLLTPAMPSASASA
jgi:hypothetical protein